MLLLSSCEGPSVTVICVIVERRKRSSRLRSGRMSIPLSATATVRLRRSDLSALVRPRLAMRARARSFIARRVSRCLSSSEGVARGQMASEDHWRWPS